MAEVKGIKETKEVVEAALIIGLLVLKSMEDGKLSLGEGLDIAKELLDKENREKFVVAAQGIKELPAELKDLSMDEVKEIVKMVLEARK
jgi:hypothetical protein